MKKALIYYVYLISAWILAWLVLLHTPLNNHTVFWQIIYWILMKFIIWILPLIFLVKYHLKQNIKEYFEFTNIKKGLKVGLLISLVFLGLSTVLNYFTKDFHLPAINLTFFSIIIFAPLLEEIAFRGFILKEISSQKREFWHANLLTSLMFLGVHFVGWYFQEKLFSTSTLMVSASILLISILLGYAKKKSNSIWGSIVFHAINNLYTTFI